MDGNHFFSLYGASQSLTGIILAPQKSARIKKWLPSMILVLVGAIPGYSDDLSRSSRAGDAPSTQPAESSVRRLSFPPAETDAIDAEHLSKAQELINAGIRYLLDQREDDGGWSLGKGAHKPAVTALVLKTLIQHPDFHWDSPEVRKGLSVLLRYRQSDGAIFDPREGAGNYSTAIAVMAMAAVDDPRLDGELRKAVEFLKRTQIVSGSRSPDGREISEDHPFVGGVSYGAHGRPDMSNVGMWMQGLHDAGVSPDDPAIQRALLFITRCQNRSESNSLAWSVDGPNDGGFVYAPAISSDPTQGESKAGPAPDKRGLRSYGSMTYVGFKSMLYAGLSRDDPRVQGAYNWICKHWTLRSNPNMPHTQTEEGIYYYYHVFAKALRAWGEVVIVDGRGVKHNWRSELIDALAQRVRRDGSWVNEASRWGENYPVLVTSYSVLGLQESLKK